MWVKLDDSIFENPKISRLSKDAKLLYLVGLTYCAKWLTDGRITPTGLRLVTAIAEAGDDSVGELVSAGLWRQDADSMYVHDWADYNPSAEKVLADRKAAKERMQRIRSPERSPEQTPNVRPSVRPPRTRTRTQVPEPIPITPAAAAIFRLYEDVIGPVPNDTVRSVLLEAEKDYPAEWIKEAFEEAALNGARKWRYVESILQRWAREEPAEEESWDSRTTKAVEEAMRLYQTT